jgi:uncharacterized cofD-like protein
VIDWAVKHCYDSPRMRRKTSSWFKNLCQSIWRELRWLTPGIGVKRWVLLILAGTMLIGLGFAVLVLDAYRTAPNTWWLPVLSYLSLRFLDRTLRAIVFGGFGLGLLLWGTWGLNRSLLRPFVRPGKTLVETVSSYRKRERGPRIVAIGGGNGLSALLRGLKVYSRNITAIVTVADDGGSSGELRRNMGILPPGDIRNCLAALSDDEELLTQIFQYRFGENAGLNGHSLGNLLITALTDLTGSFEEAIAESGRVLAVQGQVLPSTLHDVRLVADVVLPERKEEVRIKGESQIPKSEGVVRRVWLEPDNPAAYPPAVQAILAADLIVVGPGSLYTSLLPNLLVPDLARAFHTSRAVKFYICNVATQKGETDGYSCGDHVRVFEQHLGERLFDVMLVNGRYTGRLSNGVNWVKPEPDLDQQCAFHKTDLVDVENPWRHDSKKLAKAVIDLFNERTGPLTSREES